MSAAVTFPVPDALVSVTACPLTFVMESSVNAASGPRIAVPLVCAAGALVADEAKVVLEITPPELEIANWLPVDPVTVNWTAYVPKLSSVTLVSFGV